MSNSLTKYRFSGHETFPIRYGWIEKMTDFINNNAKDSVFSMDLLKPENTSVDFGLGFNMAKSLKHWVFATNILETTSKNTVKYTNAGNIIFGPEGKDKYLENINKIWFLHYKLTSSLSNCTTWAWFFNYFTESRFDKNRIFNDLITFADRSQGNFSEESLKRDIDCFLRSYTVKQISSEKLIEDGLESPFLELELIQSESSNNFFINRDFRQTLSPEIFAISLVNYIRSHNISSSTVSIDKLLYDPFSPGCIFKLNKEAIETLLEVVGSITSDNLFLDVSAGLSQVVIKNKEFVFKENIENIENLLLEKTYE